MTPGCYSQKTQSVGGTFLVLAFPKGASYQNCMAVGTSAGAGNQKQPNTRSVPSLIPPRSPAMTLCCYSQKTQSVGGTFLVLANQYELSAGRQGPLCLFSVLVALGPIFYLDTIREPPLLTLRVSSL
jgi:hypothetical protein